MDYENLRISKLREYLFNVINTLTEDRNYQINADMLGKIDDFSLNKVPTETEVERWIIGVVKRKDVYSFRSRKAYSTDTVNNLLNIGFFEKFEDKIKTNNDEGILPEIENIESIECLNCGTMAINEDGNSCIFDITIQITYRKEKEGGISL
jgi:hypothetical protein